MNATHHGVHVARTVVHNASGASESGPAVLNPRRGV